MDAAVIRPGKLSRFVLVVGRLGRLPRMWIARRRLLAQLGGLDDRMLGDIGLTRGDVFSAAAEPLFRDPGLSLMCRAEERRHAVRAAARERLAIVQLMRGWTERDRAA